MGLLLLGAWQFTTSNNPSFFDRGIPIPPNPQYPGNPEKGYHYLVTGDYLKSGLPLKAFALAKPRIPDYLGRGGANENVPYQFNIVKAPNGAAIATPNCLFCHAQPFEDSLIMGLGNTLTDYSKSNPSLLRIGEMAMTMMANQKEKEAAANLLNYTMASSPYLVAATRGVNIADRLTVVLASHRDPVTFKWLGKPQLPIPDEVIPTDVPAWWLLKKKNGMFYTGFGRGDFPRFLMAANLLTVNDTSEAAEVLTHFDDVLAYLYTLTPPKYPKPIQQDLANQGKVLFEDNCSRCHGTYGEESIYPNLLIPANIIKTDSALAESNFSHPDYINWFRKSWFAQGDRKADLVPFKGYIAPPLDGVWITAPYLHNGSVPDLESLLNSKKRPSFWERNFNNPQYDYETLGWKYTKHDRQTNRSVYNTKLRGYQNTGHYFADKISDTERQALLEYLKTL